MYLTSSMNWRKFITLNSISGTLVFIAAIPLIFVIYNSLLLTHEQWLKLWSNRLPGLIWNTLSLAVLVVLLSLLFGLISAWLISRRSFPGRKLAIWLMLLPLSIPTYVFAHIYTTMLEDDGWLGYIWINFIGSAPPNIYNVGGVALVLALASFPYIFLLVYIALSRSSRTLEESARLQGATASQVFLEISLPLLRPAIAAGIAVVTLHVLSDFGAVSMLQYRTFTLSIYLQMIGRFDYQGAAGLSFVLVLFSLTFIVLERFFRTRQRYYASAQSNLIKLKTASNLEVGLIWGFIGIVAFFAFILPVIWMMTWTWSSWNNQIMQTEFWRYTFNSMTVATITALLAACAALPIALFHARRRSILSNIYLQCSSVGFVLPGPVIALGVLVFALSQFPSLYTNGGLLILLLALVIRFLPLAVQSQEAAMQQFTPSIEQAGRILGAGPLENLWKIILPIIRGGMATALVLVFIDTLKELPATLLLRPTGFDTLPVRIWIEASEEMIELAAPAALTLVLCTLPALWLMIRREINPAFGSKN